MEHSSSEQYRKEDVRRHTMKRRTSIKDLTMFGKGRDFHLQAIRLWWELCSYFQLCGVRKETGEM